EGNGSAMFALSYAAQAGKTSENARLIFKRYNDRYFLWQIFPAGTSAGRELQPSRREQEMAKSSGKPEIVSLLVSSSGVRRAARVARVGLAGAHARNLSCKAGRLDQRRPRPSHVLHAKDHLVFLRNGRYEHHLALSLARCQGRAGAALLAPDQQRPEVGP